MKHFSKTSARELLLVIAVLIVLVLFDFGFKPDGILYQMMRIFSAVFMYFFVIKIRLHFLIGTDFNEKSEVRPRDIVKQLKAEMEGGKVVFAASEIASIVNAETQLENNKHRKAIRRETAERLAIAMIIISMFVLGVV